MRTTHGEPERSRALRRSLAMTEMVWAESLDLAPSLDLSPLLVMTNRLAGARGLKSRTGRMYWRWSKERNHDRATVSRQERAPSIEAPAARTRSVLCVLKPSSPTSAAVRSVYTLQSTTRML